MIDDKYYEVAPSGSLVERLAVLARDRIYDDFMCLCRPGSEDTIVDVGVSDVTGAAANFLERCYPFPTG